jgi:hypothetical protein
VSDAHDIVSLVGRGGRASDDLLRSVGGLLFAAGAIVLLSRKSGHGEWGDFALLLVVLIPAAVLYALALAGSSGRGSAEPDRTVLAVSAILLSPVVFVEFLRWVGASTGSRLNIAAVFAVAALLAAYTTRRARVTYAAFLGGLSALVAWLLVWSKILDHPSPNTFRWLLIAAAAILFLAAAALSFAGALGASEVATAGGVAAIGAGFLGVVVSGLLGVLNAVGRSGAPEAFFPHPHLNGAQHLGWDIYVLAVSVGLIWVGSRVRSRGLGYAGAFGLLAFFISVLAQVTRIQAGHGRTHDVVGWPLVLLLVGGAALTMGSLGRTSRSASRG